MAKVRKRFLAQSNGVKVQASGRHRTLDERMVKLGRSIAWKKAREKANRKKEKQTVLANLATPFHNMSLELFLYGIEPFLTAEDGRWLDTMFQGHPKHVF